MSVSERGAGRRRRWLRGLVVGLLVVAVLAGVASVGVVVYLHSLSGRIHRVPLGDTLASPEAQSAGAAGVQNILLTGVDSSAGLDPNDARMQDRDDENNADTIMLLRLDPAQTKAQLLSVPRDLWVSMGGDGPGNKINAALALGGPGLLIRTISANYGIPINHYMQVDFAGFQHVIDVMGGVPVAFDKPVRDAHSGLDIPRPGCVTLDGPQALNYVRSRYLEYYEDGQWKYDGWADLSRIDRQQDFMRRMAKHATAKGLHNPVTLKRLLDSGLSALTVDEHFKTSDILALASRFRSYNPDTFQTFTLPVIPDTVGDASVVRLVDHKASPVLDIFRGINPSELKPGSVHLDVVNGSGRLNEGHSTANALQDVGFHTAAVGDASTADQPQTLIRYRPDDQPAADLLARYLASPPQLHATPDLDSPGIQLVTGLDFRGVLNQPRPAPPTTNPPPTTPTTTIGVVPSNGSDHLCKAT